MNNWGRKYQSRMLLLLILFFFIFIAYFQSQNQKVDNTALTQATSNNNRVSVLHTAQLPFPLKVPQGFHGGLFATNLGKARDLEFTSGGTLLVSNPDNNQIIALKDKDGDGQAEIKKEIISQGDVVHGIAYYNDKLYIAEKNRLVRYSWNEENLTATREKTLFSYPGNQNHIYRTVVFGKDNRIYVSLGSNCNVCIEKDAEQGTVITSDEDGSQIKIFAKGQRNAPFLTVNPITHEIWATGMGRDFLGDTLPPDEINILREGKDYGWPYCYGNKIHDTNFDKRTYLTDPCSSTVAPLYEISAHSAPLGLAFVPKSFSDKWQNDLIVSYHGSWNRSSPIGYKVVHLTIKANRIVAETDLVTGFIDKATVLGRPVDVIFDQKGSLYISDDHTGNIYIISHN